jgi:EpsI family protein
MVMFISVALSAYLKPTEKFVSQFGNSDLEVLIPKKFGDWTYSDEQVQIISNVQVDEELKRIYTQTLARTYVNSHGDSVMLSLAYGDNQDRKSQIHRPEVCYAAQGFNIKSAEKVSIETPYGNLPVMKLFAQKDQRFESIIYWVRIGNKLVRGNLEQGIARVSYGLKGYIADGLLFRVSTLRVDGKSNYNLQEQFINQLLANSESGVRDFIIGKDN